MICFCWCISRVRLLARTTRLGSHTSLSIPNPRLTIKSCPCFDIVFLLRPPLAKNSLTRSASYPYVNIVASGIHLGRNSSGQKTDDFLALPESSSVEGNDGPSCRLRSPSAEFLFTDLSRDSNEGFFSMPELSTLRWWYAIGVSQVRLGCPSSPWTKMMLGNCQLDHSLKYEFVGILTSPASRQILARLRPVKVQ